MCLCLIRKKHFNNINIKSIVDSKCFWKTVKPLFSDEIRYKKTITLIENNEILLDELKVAQIFNNYFVNIVPSLKVGYNKDFLTDTDQKSNVPTSIIKKKLIFFRYTP